MKKYLLFAILAFSTQLFSDLPPYVERMRSSIAELSQMSEEKREAALADLKTNKIVYEIAKSNFALNWKGAGEYNLPLSHASLTLPEGYIVLLGEEVQKGLAVNGKSKDKSIEAYICTAENIINPIIFGYYETGFAPTDNWDKKDHKNMLNSIAQEFKNTPEVNIKSWIQEPILDKSTMTLSMAYDVEIINHNFVIATAIKFGRKGIEYIFWMTPRSEYGDGLTPLIQALSFKPGYRYEDYRMGDPLAPANIGKLLRKRLSGTDESYDLLKTGIVACFGACSYIMYSILME